MTYPRVRCNQGYTRPRVGDTILKNRETGAVELWRDGERLTFEPAAGRRQEALLAATHDDRDVRAVAFFLARLGSLDGELRQIEAAGADIAFELVS